MKAVGGPARGLLLNLLISVAPIALLVLFYLWLLKGHNPPSGNGGATRVPAGGPGKIRVTFKDLAGIDEVGVEISEVVDFLKEPQKYQLIGAKPSKGVLLSGPPGTGKSIADQGDCGGSRGTVLHASSSEFVEMIVGVGASRDLPAR